MKTFFSLIFILATLSACGGPQATSSNPDMQAILDAQEVLRNSCPSFPNAPITWPPLSQSQVDSLVSDCSDADLGKAKTYFTCLVENGCSGNSVINPFDLCPPPIYSGSCQLSNGSIF